MAISKKSFVNLDLQGNSLVNPTIGANSDMTKAGSFQYNAAEFRLEYFNGTLVEQVANLTDIAAVTGGLIFQGGYDPTTNTPDITVDNDSVKKGFFWVATVAGTFLGETVQVGDSIIAKQDNPGNTAANWLILQGNVVIATDTVDGIVRLATQAEVDAGTEGGAVVLTPATFAASQQLADINTDITNLENDKLARDGSQPMTGSLDMDNNSITNVNSIGAPEGYALSITTETNLNGNNIEGVNSITTNNVYSESPEGLKLHSSAGVVDFLNNKLSNVATPTNGGDAANKTYVDTEIAAQSYSATILPEVSAGNWISAGGGYYTVITHNLNSTSLVINTYLGGGSADFFYEIADADSINVQANNLPAENVDVSIVKAGGNL